MPLKNLSSSYGNVKIALVNPPGKYRYLRDYYCASIAKSTYYYPPIDFVWLSASFKQKFKIYDAIVKNMSLNQLIEGLGSFNPTFIFCLISGISFKEDIQFIKTIKNRLKAKLIVMGDICRDYPEELLINYKEIDAVLKSFACSNISDVLNNKFPPKFPLEGWALRINGKVIQKNEKSQARELKIGVPKWEAFPLKQYRYPFALSQPVVTVLTDYGCPYSCSFCPIGTIRWRPRELGEVVKELDLLLKLGFKEVHFRDQTFGVDKRRTSFLLKYLKKNRLRWSCFSRIDVVTENSLKAMKEAGCHTIIFGIESGDYLYRKKHGKNIKKNLIIQVLELCSKLKISTVGTFIIGLPGEGKEEALKTIDLAKNLPLDYASFNIAIPRFGSKLRHTLEIGGVSKEDFEANFNSERLGFMPYEEASGLVALANRKFYLRTSYIFNRFINSGSLSSLLNEMKIGYNLIVR